VLATPAADIEATIEACWSGEAALSRLRYVRFDDERVFHGPAGIDPGHKGEPLSLLAAQLLDRREVICKSTMREFCARECRYFWMEMIDEADRLRKAARQRWVHIVPLRL
jgi:hypothetical protein